MAYTNTRGLLSKRDKLENWITDTRALIIGLSETWLNEQVNDSKISIAGYNIYRCDRISRKGGGVILYVHNSIQSQLKDIRRDDDGYTEAVWCTLKLPSGSILQVAVIYRSPSSVDP